MAHIRTREQLGSTSVVRGRSTGRLLFAVVLALVALVWTESVKDSLECIENYRSAKSVVAVNQVVDDLLQGAQNFAFERGRTNVVLRGPAPIGQDNLVFLAQRRQAVDRLLASAMVRLEADGRTGAVREGLATIQELRRQVDAAVAVPSSERPAGLADLWFASGTRFLADVQQLVTALSLERDKYTPTFRLFTRVKILAFELRGALGTESSRLASAIAVGRPMDQEVVRELMGLRGQAAAMWSSLRREVDLTGDKRIEEALAGVETKALGEFRRLQDQVLAASAAGAPYPVTVQQYTSASVPALDSVVSLMDAAVIETRAHAQDNMSAARLSLAVYLLQLFASLSIGATALVLLARRVIRPLARIREALSELGAGNLSVEIPVPRRHDELGEVQAALAAFRDGMAERLRISGELAEQTERLQTLINAMPDFVCFKDGAGRWLVVNEYGRALFGLDSIEHLGKTDEELAALVPGCRQSLCGCADSDERAWRRDASSRGEEVVIGLDGKARFFDVIKVPVKSSDGARKGLVVVGRDITERRRIEVALSRLSRQTELILECAGEGVVGVDADGCTTFVNPAAARMTGWEMIDLMGRTHHELVHHTAADGGLSPADACPVMQTLSDGQPRHVADDVFWRKDGTSFPVEFTVTAIVEQDQTEPRGAVIVFRDIGDQKRANAEIDFLLADLQRSNRDLEQFSYAVSHDLQEPLRMVSSYVQMLARRYEGKLDQSADEFIGFAVDGAKRMSQMINSLLEYARVGTRGEEPHPVDAGAAMRRALVNLSLVVSESGASVSIPEDAVWVMGDDNQLVALFQNLIANAIKYRSPERLPVVAVTAVRAGGRWTVTVADNGIGIAEQDRERVFGVFQRLEARPGVDGMGVGLSICKRIVERLGGRIWVEDTNGGGTRFVFTLNAADPES
ncbi:MAG: ATP-binding protein [Solirubrobacterales bacterium]